MARKTKPNKSADGLTADQQKEKNQVATWKQRISAAEEYRKKIGGRYHWREITEGYKCHLDSSLQDQSIYVPALNYFFAYVKTEIPSISLRDPKIKVNPKKGASIASAKILEKALAYLWRTKRTKRENKKNILDAKTVGHSWFKVGYTGQFGAVEDGSDKAFEYIKSQDFFGYRVPYETITFSPDSLDPPFDCGWIAQEVWLPLDEVKENPLFNKEVTADLEPSTDDSILNMSGDERNDGKDSNPDKGKSDPAVGMIKLYEVWDKTGGVKFVICDQCEYYLQAPVEWPYLSGKFPFAFLGFNDNPDSGYPIPDCFAFESQVYELTKVRAQQIDHIKRFNRQLLARDGAITEDEEAKFSVGQTGAVIKAKIGDDESLSNVIMPIQYPPLPTDIYNVELKIKEDMINVSGQSPQERGATQQTSTRTFRELAQMDRGAKNRRSDQIDAFEDFIEDIARGWIALLQQYADLPFYVSVTGKEPQEIMQAIASRKSAGMEGAITADDGFTFTKEDIQGEFDIEVVAGSTAPMDSENRMEKLTSILAELPQLGVMPGGPVIAAIGRGLAEELDMPDVEMAIEAEQKLAQQQAQEAKEQQQLQQGMVVAQQSAELELKAQKEARDQNELLLKVYELMAQIKKDRDVEKGKVKPNGESV